MNNGKINFLNITNELSICSDFHLTDVISIFLGLLSWNVLECHVDLEEELNNITNHAPEGEAARHGNYLSISFIVKFYCCFYSMYCATLYTNCLMHRKCQFLFNSRNSLLAL